MSERRLIRIGELARQARISVRTIHYYEEMNLLEPAARTGVGYRLYERATLQRLETIRRMKLLGLKLAEIRFLMKTYEEEGACGPVRQQLRELLHSHIQRIEEQIADLNHLKVKMEAFLNRLEGQSGTATAIQAELRCQEALGISARADARRLIR